jgi:cytochrome P450
MQRHLRSHPQDIPAYVEEAIRVHSPVAGTFRWALRDTEVAGVTIPKGSTVQVQLVAGNRDAAAFSCPASVDPGRDKRNVHLAFGRGIHFCVGSKLARKEMQKALQAIFSRTSSLELDPDALPSRFGAKIPVRGVDRLPVRFTRSTH